MVGPQKYEKTKKKVRKWPKNGHFGIWGVFFFFVGPGPGWGILSLFVFFFCVFSGLQGFLGSVPGPRDRTSFGDKFGESLGGSQATPSFWEVPGLPRKFPKLPRKFFGDFPGGSLTVELYSNPGVPRKFPRLPRKFPGLPRKFPGLPRRSALSLGSLTPSPDSQKLSLSTSWA